MPSTAPLPATVASRWKLPSGAAVVVVYGALAVGLAVWLVHTRGSDLPLYLFIAPVLLASVLYPRSVYLAMIAVAVFASTAMVTRFFIRHSSSYPTIATIGVMLVLVCEFLNRLTQWRLEMQGRLRQLTETLTAVLDSSPVAIIVLDEGGSVRMWNPAAERMFGWTEAEVSGRPLSLLADPGSALVEPTLTGDALDGIEVRCGRKESGLVDVSISTAPLAGPSGQAGIVVAIADVTERRRTEAALARERDLLQILMANMPHLIYFKDTKGRFSRVNVTQAQYLGLSDPGQARGTTDADHYPPEIAEQLLEDDRHVLRTGTPIVDKVEQVRIPTGEMRWLLTTKVPFRDEEGRVAGLVGMGRDITERIQAEEELRRTAQELRRTADELQRSNEDLQQFAYVASHDLQEPLRMVASYTQLLARRYKDRLDGDANEFIRFAVDGATRMQVLINDLLAYSRVGTRGRPFEPVSLMQPFREAVSNLKVALQESGASVDCDPLPTVMADPSQMTQLFQNLIGNAIKFHGERRPHVHVRAERAKEDSLWILSVRDNGIGIPEEYAERIFVIFQRLHTREEYAGSGIGLSICKKIVTRHGGRIWFESTPGDGTTFYFTLPDGNSESEE